MPQYHLVLPSAGAFLFGIHNNIFYNVILIFIKNPLLAKIFKARLNYLRSSRWMQTAGCEVHVSDNSPQFADHQVENHRTQVKIHMLQVTDYR